MRDFGIKGKTIDELEKELQDCKKSIADLDELHKKGGSIPPDFHERCDLFAKKIFQIQLRIERLETHCKKHDYFLTETDNCGKYCEVCVGESHLKECGYSIVKTDDIDTLILNIKGGLQNPWIIQRLKDMRGEKK